MSCIEVKNLTKKFAELVAVDNISFNVEEGEIFGLLGSNGAGKTTTMNILTGLLLPTEGEVKILGMNIRENIEEIREEVSIVPQEISLYEELSVYENLKFFGKIYAKNKGYLNEKINELLVFFSLEDKKDKLVSQLSGGYQRRVSIAAALLANPRILLLDEPTSGIDIATNQLIMEYIKNKGKETTIILTTHSIKEAETVCDRILFLHEGKTLLYGNPSSLVKQYAKYFGERVFVQFDGKLSEEEINKLVRKYKDSIKNYSFGEGFFIFDTINIGEVSLNIINSLRKKDLKISNIDIQKPSLEDVFKYLIKRK
jgi:ABC-2 type transport system ATP-binding protein